MPKHPDNHEHGGPDWFAALDIVVWVTVALIAAIGVEWFVGRLVRERIAAGASRYLARVTPVTAEE